MISIKKAPYTRVSHPTFALRTHKRWVQARNRWVQAECRSKKEAVGQAMRLAIIALLVGTLLALLVLLAFAMSGDDMDLRTFFAVEKLDYAQKLTYLAALAAVDYKQTENYQMSNRGNFEVNPILGPHPSRRDLQMFGLAGLASVWLFMEYVPEGTLKHVLLDSVIASEQANVREDRDSYRHHKTALPIMIVASFRF